MIPGTFNPYAYQAQPVAIERQCPHCRAVSQVMEGDEMVRVCGICGGPRISFAEGIVPSQATNDALRRAERARRGRSTARALGYVGTMSVALAALVFAFTALVGGLGWAIGMGGVTGLLSMAMILRSTLRSRAQTEEMKKHLDDAWASAAHDAFAAGKASNARELAAALGIDVARAEELHARESVEASLGPAGDEDHPRSNVPHDPRFDALEQKVRVVVPSPEPEGAAGPEHAEEADAEASATVDNPSTARRQ